MAVHIDGNRAYNIEPDNCNWDSLPAAMQVRRDMVRIQSAVSTIISATDGTGTPAYALDCIHDMVHTLMVAAETLAHQLDAYGFVEHR